MSDRYLTGSVEMTFLTKYQDHERPAHRKNYLGIAFAFDQDSVSFSYKYRCLQITKRPCVYIHIKGGHSLFLWRSTKLVHDHSVFGCSRLDYLSRFNYFGAVLRSRK